MRQTNPLFETLKTIADRAEGPPLTLGDLVDELGARGFGPLFVLLGALVALPTGAIPGVPALVGACLVLLSGQLILGWPVPWLPRRLRDRRIGRQRLKAALDRARPVVLRIGRVLRPRLTFLASGPVALRAAAAVVLLASSVMIPIGFIPLLPLLIGGPIVAIGLGLMVRDGVFLLCGVAALTAPAWLILRQLG